MEMKLKHGFKSEFQKSVSILNQRNAYQKVKAEKEKKCVNPSGNTGTQIPQLPLGDTSPPLGR
jgi:hypothetical protein